MPARDFGRFPGIVVSLAMVWRLDWEDEFTNWKNMFGNRCGNVQKFGATSICHDSAYGKRLVGLCFNMPGGGHPIRQAHGGSTKSTGSLSCSNKKHAMFFSGLTNFQTKNTKKHQKNREHLELLQLYHGWNLDQHYFSSWPQIPVGTWITSQVSTCTNSMRPWRWEDFLGLDLVCNTQFVQPPVFGFIHFT